MLKLQKDSKKAKVIMDNKQEFNIKQDSKQDEIINMFNDIAKTYDTTNRVMSMGIDISWRKEACKEAFQILNKQKLDIADIACGTGDMMLHWEQSSKDLGIEIASIEGIDPSSGMLDQAREKIPHGVFKVAQANNLPLESCSKDIISIAYGLRNVVEREAALKEFYRVLRPNGVLVILEFTTPNKHNVFSKLMQFYTKNILPIVGGLISRNFKAYRYLPDSIDSFVTRESLEAELLACGMPTIFAKSYSANVSSLLIAQKQE
ncbi:bifunctional demethylmenaquinone methyltransferase/2-methoxy-6-polyprenyl-1,4-benzoquinol methylase UbiE [Helicobacter bilis]|uniref:bifunctional demethylmenaquinone methyltransferase/2-methoxy-6-polyprenyl-1,4-benzoquinol methylase UbiE n=1 Tax=Helicobacter bilis TaxID=37372 RepID=UPI001F43699C|nr:bifunctional demethylmenaquinone methyltransferase/2-methoxy-6-polyprenyl-1,4-benzoquinol methylase UbiE [Helicobacter bilis]